MKNGMILDPGKRHRIGFIIQESTGAGGFQELVWYSMVEAARRHDVNVLMFAGGSLDTTPWNPHEKSMNLVYDLIDREYLDGIVVCTPVGNYVSVERFQQFCRQFQLPVVTVVGSLKGFPGVRANNRNGMRDAILHLIEEHRARKIAFIKGTTGNKDAEERLTVFKETMGEAGLPIDPDLVYDGIFNEDSGLAAAEYFVLKKGKSFDAIVSSNDAMAFGAISGLRKNGIEVPWDVRVTGFDDTVEARGTIPSLTTVQQPLGEMCGAALDVLDLLIQGKPAEETVVIPTRLVVRQTCGCSSALVRQAGDRRTARPGSDADRKPVSGTEQADILRKEALASAATEDERQASEVVAAFLDDVSGAEPPALLPKLRRIFQDTVIRGGEISGWQRALGAFRKWSGAFWTERETAARADDVVFQAMVLAGEYSQQALACQSIKNEKKAKELTAAGQQLITTFNFDALKDVVKTQLALLRIPSFFISVYRDAAHPTAEAEIFAASQKGGGGAVLRYGKHQLPETDFFPVDRRYTYAVHPLCIYEHKLGYAMFELGPEDGLVYNTIQVQISSSLMGSELIRQREKTEAAEKNRSDCIQELVRPMISSIGEVTKTAREKIGMIGDLIAVTTESGEKLDSTNTAIKAMNEKIARMSDVIGLIDDISSRVNIMAINTSIESAHAGEYGKGFAVIAAEIRKLADSIKANATVIAEYLKDIRPMIDGSRKAGDSSREAFRRLEKDVADVAQTLRQITGSMDDLSAGSSKILSLMNIT